MLRPQTRKRLQIVRLVSAIAVVGVVILMLKVRPNPYAGRLFLAFISFGFPAAIATLAIKDDNRHR